jgi:glycosidase
VLNYRDIRAIEAVAGAISWFAAHGVTGCRLDVAHNFGTMLPANKHLKGKQKLFGAVTSWERNARNGFRVVNDWDFYEANPYLMHLVSRISSEYPDFVFVGENYHKYIQVIKSGVIPMNSGTHDELEFVFGISKPAKSKYALDDHFRWLLGDGLPRGAQVVTALETHDYYRLMDRWQSFGPARLKAAVWIWLATARGAIMVYNRQELGEVHRARIDNYTNHNYAEADRQRYYAQLDFEALHGETVQGFYSRVFAFFRNHPALRSGKFWIHQAHDNVFAITRILGGDNVTVLANTGWQAESVRLDMSALWDTLGVEASNRLYQCRRP